jgi:hypothetical protein
MKKIEINILIKVRRLISAVSTTVLPSLLEPSAQPIGSENSEIGRLNGLSHEIDLKNFDKNLQNLA